MNQNDTLLGHDRRFGYDRRVRFDDPILLDSGESLAPLEVAYETYGTLNADRSNAILVCHALTGDQYVASTHPITGKPGWWPHIVGPGKPVDTDHYCVICVNVLGSCMGSSGPSSTAPDGQPWAMRFPVITIRDMVRAQARLLDHLGIERLWAVVGGSMGGMQAMEWSINYPDRVRAAIVIAAAARQSAQNIAMNEVGRQAIMADPRWRKGNYYADGDPPTSGLAVARMAAHISYLSASRLTEKFGRRLQDRDRLSFGLAGGDFQIESYLRHQGIRFVERFDANSYLYITRALDYFDIAARYNDSLVAAFAGCTSRFCIISCSSDWLYPTPESRRIVQALNASAAHVSFIEINSNYGHDAFLLDVPELARVVDGFLGAKA